MGNLLSNCLDIEEIGGITKGWHPHPDYTIRLSDGPLGQRPAQDTGHNEKFEEDHSAISSRLVECSDIVPQIMLTKTEIFVQLLGCFAPARRL